MANEKVYVGKAGAQELYTRVEEHIDARIPKVSGAEGNVGKFTEDGSLEDTGVSATDLENAVQNDHTHGNKEVLDSTTAAYTTEEQEKLVTVDAGAEVNEIVTVKVDGTALTPDENRAVNIDLSGKVDVVPGKQLSTNDYTSAEKDKLAGMEDFVESFIAPDYDPTKTVYYQGEICMYEDKCYRAKNIIMNGGSAIGAFDSSKWAETNFADSRLQILNYYVNYVWPSVEVTNKAIQSGALVGLRYITPTNPQYYEKKNTMYWLHSYYMDNAGNVRATFINTENDVAYNKITYSIIKYTSSGNDHWTKENDLSYPFYTYDDQYKLSRIANGAQVNAIESISANSTALTIDANKNVDIPLATGNNDGLLPKAKFPLIPAAPEAGADRIYSFDDEHGTSWQTIVQEYVGNIILDQQSTPVVEEAVALWLSYKGVEFGARRAYEDHTGANIHNSIAARTTMAQVTTAIEAALAKYGGFVVVSLTQGDNPVPDVQDPSTRFIYLTKEDPSSKKDPYTEWIWVEPDQGVAHWDVIGETTVDVSNFTSKVPNAEGNIPALDANGDLVNSGVAAASLTSKAAADGGTDLSLVTTGEKYVWNDWTSANVDIPPINGVRIGGRKYEVKKFGNQVWMMESIKYDTDVSDAVYIKNGIYHYKADYVFHNAEFTALIPSGWRIPTINDRNALAKLAGGETTAAANYLRNNFNVEPSTMYNGYGNYPGSDVGWQFSVMTVGNGPIGGIVIRDNTLLNSNNVGGNDYGVSMPLRLCKDAIEGE